MTPKAHSRRWMLHCVWLFVLAAALYSNSLPNGFVSDDQALILNHPYTKSLADVGSIFRSGHFEGGGGYRPLTTLSFALNYQLGALHPGGYHLVNLLLHGLSAAGIFLLLRKLFRSDTLAIVSAVIFAVHPIHTEAVTWISGRAELLACGFLLGSWLLYLHATATHPPLRRRSLALSLLLFFAAMLSKENALLLPVMLLLGDLYRREPDAEPRPPASRLHWPLYALYCGLIVFYFLFRTALYQQKFFRDAGHIAMADNVLVHADWWPRVLTALRIQGEYLGLLAWPARLSADYSFDQTPVAQSLADPAVLAALLGVSALVGFAVWTFRTRRGPLGFGILFYFLTLGPTSNLLFVIGTIKAERLLYLPSLGFCVGAGALWMSIRQRTGRVASSTPRFVALAMLILMLCLLSARTWRRTRDWRDESTFAAATAQNSPRSVRAQMFYGSRCLSSGQNDQATAAFRAALKLQPEDKEAILNLGVSLLQAGQNNEALALLTDGANRFPADAGLRLNLGLARASHGDLATAMTDFRHSSQLDPQNAAAHFNFALASSLTGTPQNAVDEYRIALRLKPDYAEAWNGLGAALIKLHRTDEARDALREALRIRPGYPDASRNLKLLAP